MFQTGLELRPECPNCGGLLHNNNDGYEGYLTCLSCAREFNLDMTLKRMTPAELYDRKGIKLTNQEKFASMRTEM